MGQPTQRATNYTARSNIDTAQIFLHANGQRLKRAMIRQRSRRRQRRGEPHTEHGLGVPLNTFYTHTAASMKRDRRKSLCSLVYGYTPPWICNSSGHVWVNQAESVIRIRVTVSQVYVNTYSTPRPTTQLIRQVDRVSGDERARAAG